jgi:AraC-like DNA-binding protein
MSTPPASLLDLSFRHPTHPGMAIEGMRLGELRRRMPPGFFRRVQRPRFHLLAIYLEGQGIEEVDFVRIACRPGTVIHVHPGQVIRYVSIAEAEAFLVLFTPEFLWPDGVGLEARLRDGLGMPSHLDLAEPDFESVKAIAGALEREYAATDAGPLSEAILRHLLTALLLRVDQAASRDQAVSAALVQHDTFTRFRRALETSYMQTRAVQDYADRLGCAPRTLNRATLAMAGMPVKRYIDERVTLEAKRLLAHTTLHVAAIATRLGFTEPTNFVKFFRRHTGRLPGEFREAQLGAPRP